MRKCPHGAILFILLVTVVCAAILVAMYFASGLAKADHQGGCIGCASHAGWPAIDGILAIQKNPENAPARFTGTPRSDELLGHHGSDRLIGLQAPDVLWGDYDPTGQPRGQVDRLAGGSGNDYLYGSHGRNYLRGGPGNDRIRSHFGRGYIDCGPGFDRVHVARSRRGDWRIVNCERFDYRPEAQGGQL